MRRAIIILLGNILFLSFSAWGADKVEKQDTSDKLDIKKLEEQYWSPKDSEFNVIQNRLYEKSDRFAYSVSTGTMVNDSYTQGLLLGAAINYFPSENWGLEFNYIDANLKNSKTTQDFVDEFGVIPNHNRLGSSSTLSLVTVPFYAKMSFIGKKILYFDMSFGFGVGYTQYRQQTEQGDINKLAPHVSIDISQHFYVNENWAVRIDFRNQLSSQEKVRYRLSPTMTEANDRFLKKETIHDTLLMIGVTFYK